MDKRDKGYTRIPNAILDDPTLTPAAKIVWLLVASYRDGCTLSTRDIAAMLHIDRGAVLDALAALVSAGLLRWDKGVGSRRSFLAVNNGRENQPLQDTKWLEKPTNNGRKNQPLPPIISIKKNKNNIYNNLFISGDAHDAHTREETTTDAIIQSVTSGQWAEAMMKNYELSADTLLWLVNDAIIYLYASNKPITEQAVKTAAMNSARINCDQLRARKKKADLKATPIQVRKDGFRAAIAPHVDKYGRDLCNRFFRHWTECDDDGIMRFERCTAWNTESRLANFT